MNVTYNALDKSINQNLISFYLLYGDESYLIEKSIEKIKKKFGNCLLGINYILIDESNINQLIANIETPSFGYDKKLIIVKNSGLFKKDGRKKTATPIQEKVCAYIKDNLEIIEESVIVVFVEKDVDKTIVYEQIDANGVICQINELKPIQLVKKLKEIVLLEF